MTDEIELEGEHHYFANKGNPYPIYTDEFNRFERGWTQALKKSKAGLIKPPPIESQLEYPLIHNSASSYPSVSNSQKAEQYKKQKG